MSTTIDFRSEIPDAPYYVLSNDRFMSGWGYAAGKTNTIILPCESVQEALFVESMAHLRNDQTRIRIVSKKPTLRKATVFYSLMTREDATSFYTLDFSLTRTNDPAKGLRLDCQPLREAARGDHYNVYVKNAASRGLHSLTAQVASIGEAIALAASLALEVGCRSITIGAGE